MQPGIDLRVPFLRLRYSEQRVESRRATDANDRTALLFDRRSQGLLLLGGKLQFAGEQHDRIRTLIQYRQLCGRYLFKEQPGPMEDFCEVHPRGGPRIDVARDRLRDDDNRGVHRVRQG